MAAGSDEEGLERELQELIPGRSPAMASLRGEIAAVCRFGPRSLLVRGETGSGKELVPRALLAGLRGRRAHLEVFNCPAVPADHLEAELLGTVRGAYPGAVDRPGAVERADGGLLFLDEIAAMPESHQGKVLRLLESGEGRRLGATSAYRVDVFFVAASNEDLAAATEAGRFRPDLYYRLVQDGVLRVPPLRERAEDVPFLARRFLAELPSAPPPSDAALDLLAALPWPGNVRQLRAVVRSAARACRGGRLLERDVRGALDQIDLGAPALRSAPRAESAAPVGARAFETATAEVRRSLLVGALEAAGGNRTLAGVLLGMHARRGERGAEGTADGAPDLRARKLAHRRFQYWWSRLA